jgi:glyoxylase-like metal-dependent hydrolase (beta-lactamase superfamily II)
LFSCEPVCEGVTRINLPCAVCAYYLEGSRRGLLIDTGYGYGDLKGFVGGLATQPYDVALTHGHVDHAGGAAQFGRVYMSQRDLPVAEIHTELAFRADYLRRSGVSDLLPELMVPMRPIDTYDDLVDGQRFDLGGLTATFLALPGHTPGSMVAHIPERSAMLFGDAVNSATYLQFPEASPLEEYRQALRAFDDEWGGSYDRALFSHPHNIGGPGLLAEMVGLLDTIVADPSRGMDVSVFLGEGVRVAKPVNESLMPVDGTTANFFYRV